MATIAKLQRSQSGDVQPLTEVALLQLGVRPGARRSALTDELGLDPEEAASVQEAATDELPRFRELHAAIGLGHLQRAQQEAISAATDEAQAAAAPVGDDDVSEMELQAPVPDANTIVGA